MGHFFSLELVPHHFLPLLTNNGPLPEVELCLVCMYITRQLLENGLNYSLCSEASWFLVILCVWNANITHDCLAFISKLVLTNGGLIRIWLYVFMCYQSVSLSGFTAHSEILAYSTVHEQFKLITIPLRQFWDRRR